MASTPNERALLAKAAAHASWAKTDDKSARTSNARAAHDRKFLDEAGGDPEKAAHLRTAHFAKLAAKSAIARRKAREAREESRRAERELAAYGDPADFTPPAPRAVRTRQPARVAQLAAADEFTVKWSALDGEWLATCSRFPSLSWLAVSPSVALDGLLEAMVDDD